MLASEGLSNRNFLFGVIRDFGHFFPSASHGARHKSPSSFPIHDCLITVFSSQFLLRFSWTQEI